ncbi:MAG: sulfatase-modifying factor protein, partial [Sphingobacteriales bacterium]
MATAQTDSSFVLVPGGTYSIGGKAHVVNPMRKVRVDSFYIAATELTNASFKKFVDATGYVTDAERLHNALVFEPGLEEFKWKEDYTASWRYPNGIAAGGIADKMNHPVTTISYQDALAYCDWAKVRLPTLPEWEIVSRAGSATTYFWGEDPAQIAVYANVWNGRNHLVADSSDGYMYTAPVASFKPNAWGLYDMYGNVFEFCSGTIAADRPGKPVAHARGGSWWCSKNACNF